MYLITKEEVNDDQGILKRNDLSDDELRLEVEKAVTNLLEALSNKDYENYYKKNIYVTNDNNNYEVGTDIAGITKLDILEVQISEMATLQYRERYTDYRMLINGIEKEVGYLKDNLVAVHTLIYREVDYTKSFLEDGYIEEYLIMVYDDASEDWYLWSRSQFIKEGDEYELDQYMN